MRLRIQKSMVLVLSITLLISYFVLTVVVYSQNMQLLKMEVGQEARYIKTAINISGAKYLDEMDEVDVQTRITRIDTKGSVLYDSKRDGSTLDNHASRTEVKHALSKGTGEDIRVSGTVGKKLYYYAVLLEDGTVLRVAKQVDGLVRTALNIMPAMGILTLSMLIFAWLMSKWQTARLIKPINELDLEHPLDSDVYEELTPLLHAMDQQNKEKDAVSNMRKEFSANVSHELKTPLTSISGYAEIMKNGMVKQEDVPKFSERIYKEAKRLISLIEDTIKLSRLDEEAVQLEKQDVDLYVLCREIVSRLAHQAGMKKVHMEVTGEPIIYHGIRQILDEMIYNVCENAIKYNVPDGEVSVWAGNTLEGAKIIVTDSGIGIPKEDHERIFERFYRVDKSHSKERGGTGLGLSIVKHGALLHGAKVTVSSEYGKGTRVEFKF